jgi:hypothetical protein
MKTCNNITKVVRLQTDKKIVANKIKNGIIKAFHPTLGP